MERDEDVLAGMSDELFKVRNEDELAQEKRVKKELNKVENSKLHKNCYRGDLSKDEKKMKKKVCRQGKRNEKKKKAKDKKKEFLQGLPEEERIEWIEEKGRKVLEEKKAAAEKLTKGRESGLNVIVDCGFENQMNVKELKSLAQQLNYVHLRMKKSENLFRLALINYTGGFPEISKERNINNWTFADLEVGDITEYVNKRGLNVENLVYLSPDADEELESFDYSKVYIIGGIVDATVNLNQTREKAKEFKIKSQKLPLDQFRKVNHFRPCLNINTVFYIIDNYLASKDMTLAILDALPERFKEEYLEKCQKTKPIPETEISEKDVVPGDQKMEEVAHMEQTIE